MEDATDATGTAASLPGTDAARRGRLLQLVVSCCGGWRRNYRRARSRNRDWNRRRASRRASRRPAHKPAVGVRVGVGGAAGEAHDARAIVVVANSLLTYRDVISATLGVLRPHLRVVSVEPEELDRELSRLAPDSVVLVVCSRVTPAVESRATAWLELYPGHGSGAVVSLGGKRTAYPEMDFDTLLSVVDDAGRVHETA